MGSTTSRDGRDEDGAPLYWQGVMHETVDRPATLERLQEAEQRYRALVEHTPVVTYIDPHRPDHTSAYFSPQVEALLGYTPDELTRDIPLWPELVHPEDRERILGASMLAGQTNGTYDVEYRMIAKDGRVVWVHDQAVRSETMGATQVLEGVGIDLTEQKRAPGDSNARSGERKGRRAPRDDELRRRPSGRLARPAEATRGDNRVA